MENTKNATIFVDDTNAAVDPVYAYYKNAGFSPNMVSMYGALWLLSIAGVLLNLMLAYVTWKSRSLHGRCNFLLAFNSATIIPLQLFSTVKFGILLSGINYIPLRTCYIFAAIPLIGAGLATSAQLCIGIDRLISVVFPIWYRNDRWVSIGLLMAFCTIRTFCVNCQYFYSVTLRPDKPVMCATGDTVGPEIMPFIYQEGLVLFCTEFLSYLLIWLIIFCKHSDDVKKVKSLMKSLTIIMTISFLIYIQGNSWRVILTYVKFDAFAIEYYVSFPTTCLYMVAFGSNMPILLAFSPEYRRSFGKHLGWIYPYGHQSIASQPPPPIVTRKHPQIAGQSRNQTMPTPIYSVTNYTH